MISLANISNRWSLLNCDVCWSALLPNLDRVTNELIENSLDFRLYFKKVNTVNYVAANNNTKLVLSLFLQRLSIIFCNITSHPRFFLTGANPKKNSSNGWDLWKQCSKVRWNEEKGTKRGQLRRRLTLRSRLASSSKTCTSLESGNRGNETHPLCTLKTSFKGTSVP